MNYMYAEYKKLVYLYRVLLTSPISIYTHTMHITVLHITTRDIKYCMFQILVQNTHLNLRNVVLQFVYPLLVLSSIIIVYTTNPYIATRTYIHQVSGRDATIHNLDVSIYCHLCITIQRYIA